MNQLEVKTILKQPLWGCLILLTFSGFRYTPASNSEPSDKDLSFLIIAKSLIIARTSLSSCSVPLPLRQDCDSFHFWSQLTTSGWPKQHFLRLFLCRMT